jgi:hypothetical protein
MADRKKTQPETALDRRDVLGLAAAVVTFGVMDMSDARAAGFFGAGAGGSSISGAGAGVVRVTVVGDVGAITVRASPSPHSAPPGRSLTISGGTGATSTSGSPSSALTATLPGGAWDSTINPPNSAGSIPGGGPNSIIHNAQPIAIPASPPSHSVPPGGMGMQPRQR